MRNIWLFFIMIASLCSCKAVSNFIHDDEVVARVGSDKLYLSELRQVVPQGLTPADSANLADQYINAWAMELLYLRVADRQLTKDEKDVSSELEAYRRTLLKYRYEQRYVGDRLDTLVTDAQVASYYEANQDHFKLKRPVVKFLYATVSAGSRCKDEIARKMASDKLGDRMVLDSLLRTQALRFVDSGDEWKDVVVLSEEFDVDYTSLLSMMKESYIRLTDADGNLRVAYVSDIRRSGVAPVEYCRGRIRDIILSARKHEILSSLERDLLKDALDDRLFVINQGQ